MKGSPFDIKECLTVYDQSTNKQQIVAYEGSAEFESLKDNTDYNYFIEFPAFYYKRDVVNSPLEWWVSKYNYDGYLPSPMHYRNNILYKNVYVSKYFLDTNLKSRFATRSSYNNNQYYKINGSTSLTMSHARTALKNQGMYVMDYAAICAINMLIFIKYGYIDTRPIVGGGAHNTNLWGVDQAILGKDGYSKDFSSSNTVSGIITCMGLRGYIGDAPMIVDGLKMAAGVADSYGSGYIGTNIENLSWSNITEVSALMRQSGWGGDYYVAQDQNHPWVMYCGLKNTGNSYISNDISYYHYIGSNEQYFNFGCWDMGAIWTVLTLCGSQSYPNPVRGFFLGEPM